MDTEGKEFFLLEQLPYGLWLFNWARSLVEYSVNLKTCKVTIAVINIWAFQAGGSIFILVKALVKPFYWGQNVQVVKLSLWNTLVLACKWLLLEGFNYCVSLCS